MIDELPKKLPDEEIKELFKKYKDGDITAREKIILHNMTLVKWIVYTYFKNTNYDKDDLFSIGYNALIDAVDRYDINSDNNFSTFATICVKNKILYFLNQENKRIDIVELNNIVNENSTELIDFIIDDTKMDIETSVEDKLMEWQIIKEIEKLPIKVQTIMFLYLGIHVYDRLKENEIAKQLNVTKQYVSAAIKHYSKKIAKNIYTEEQIKTLKKSYKMDNEF